MLGYNIYAYGRMLGDRVRTDAYAQALRRAVNPDSVVLDLGTGVGILALLAAKAGARKVYAVDPNDGIQVAREMATINGCADKIVFIQDLSTRIALPEPATLVVTDMHGIVPMFEQSLPSIIDARRRLLARGGRVIPEKESLWAAPISAPKSRDQVSSPWSDRPYGFDWTPAIRIAQNDWFKLKDKADASDFFAPPQQWATIDYNTLESPNVHGQLSWKAIRDGECHGLVVWFDTQLIDDIGFSNAPTQAETIFGQAFFPWEDAVMLSIDDQIDVDLRCDLIDNYNLWRWTTTVRRPSGEVSAQFKQSTFFGMPISAVRLRQQSGEYAPQLNRDGEIRHFILSVMNGRHSIENIASQTSTHFSDRFSQPADARQLVVDLAEKYAT